jgi:Tol biopolymer transport system component/DNA-binding winged helix-turn-helix (wHTH) protein
MLSAVATRYVWDDFVLDLDTYRLERAGVPLSLEPKAFNLLALMVRRPGHLFSKQELFEAVWPDTAVTDHALTRVVAQLRKVLGDEAREGKFLETVPTRGYRWIRPVQEIPESFEAAPPAVTIPPAPPVPVPQRWISKGVAAGVALTAAVLLFLFWPQRTVPAAAGDATHPVQWPVQLTTHSGLDLHPAVSPTGDAIALASDRSGAFEIYVRALGGSTTEVPLTSDAGQNVQPAWSPDGRFIAYHSYRKGGIWVIPARGGTPRQVAATGSKPAWSPDSRRIAFQSDEHADVAPTGFGAQTGSTLWSVNLDGADVRALTEAGRPLGGHAAPSWSPDGRRVAFTVFDGGRQDGLWILDLQTRQSTLVEQGNRLYESVFAPDSSAIYIAGGEPLIVRIPLDPSTAAPRGPREVIPIAGVPGVRGLTISSDGKRIAFAGLASNSHIWAQPIAQDGSPAGAPVQLTSDTSRRNTVPVVSPDGSRVAYMSSRRGGLPNVWVIGIDGSLPTQLTSEETAEYQPTWSPDGRRVAYLSNRGGSQGLWAVDIATRREEQLVDVSALRARRESTSLKGTLAELQLSPTLTRVAFSLLAPPEGRRVIYLAGIDPFSPRALTDAALSIGYPAWSPDERSLAVEIKDGSSTHAGIVDIDTGRLSQLTRERGQTWVRSWSPDGRRIAVAALRAGSWNLRWIDVKTGHQGPMTEPGPPRVYVRYPVWSPRGDAVVFERAEMLGNIWTLQLGN